MNRQAMNVASVSRTEYYKILIKYISVIIIDTVGIEKGNELRLEITFRVMFALIIYVGNDLIFVADRYRKCPVPFLPFKLTMFRKRVVDPFRGSAFDQLHCLRNAHCLREQDQQMYVVLNTARRDQYNTVCPGDAADIWK